MFAIMNHLTTEVICGPFLSKVGFCCELEVWFKVGLSVADLTKIKDGNISLGLVKAVK